MIFAYFQSEISEEGSETMNFYERSYQPILCFLYTVTLKRPGESVLPSPGLAEHF